MTSQEPEPKSAAVTWALVSSPFVLLLLFVALALYVRQALGHWPTPMRENYHPETYRQLDGVVTLFAMFTVYAAIPLWLGALCFRVFRISKRTHLIQAGMYVLGWVLILVYGMVDPGKFVSWYLD
jgi:hypothetical protein